ncbi:hypothetical protein BS50DRAFT_682008 [Corynespora cassiicola Philippines]|uniref:Uncharacterized protein n=1 Tax=Corynespora cassiicola Philippines TaxID=1448308 RepID=A0A2T2N3D4_CORCC|nr:hypothetical protein BS50DRAFT_682008 [Corynespora cassiicola Philippines]
MAPSSKQFPFQRLPREIRDKIYKNLLCSFGDPPIAPPAFFTTGSRTVFAPDQSKPPVMKSHVDTAILRTNSDIHREAYSTMTKTNRFVLLQSKGNIPLHRVITRYVMSITFSSDTPVCDPTEGKGKPEGPLFNIDPCSFVMLAEDLKEFTETMGKADDSQFKGLSSFLKISVQLGPNIVDELPHYKDSLATFFT